MSSTTVQNIGGDRIIIAEQVSPTIGLVYDSTLGTWSPTLSEAGRIANANYVWDTGTLAWVKMTQATGGGGGTGGLTDAQLRASPVPVSLSSTTVTGSVAVTGPLTDTQLRASAVIVSESKATSSSKSSVAASVSDTLLLAANSSRKGGTVYNDSSAILYLSLGTVAASTSSYTLQCAAASYYEFPFGYIGEVRGIWAAASGNARVTELT